MNRSIQISNIFVMKTRIARKEDGAVDGCLSMGDRPIEIPKHAIIKRSRLMPGRLF